MKHSQQLVRDSNSCLATISDANKTIKNNQFKSRSSTINNISSNNTSSRSNCSINCNPNSCLEKINPPELILVPKQLIGKIMETYSSSVPSALFSFLSPEEIQSVSDYKKRQQLTCRFRVSSSRNTRSLENWFCSLSIVL